MSEGKSTSSRLVACLSTLYLFSKIKADLMVRHATTLQPYLDIKCSVSSSCVLSDGVLLGARLELSWLSIGTSVLLMQV